jgi:GxxExxY protein
VTLWTTTAGMGMDDLNLITGRILESAFAIHARLGPGLVEHAYEMILCKDLSARGLYIERQKPISVEYEGLLIPNAFRADIIVERAIVVEVKSHATLTVLNEKQLLTYLRIGDYRLGLLLNFGCALMKDGVKRMVNRY